MLRVLGVIGVIVGIGLIVMTATGGGYANNPVRGYGVGAILIVFGIVRFVRGASQ